MRFFQAFFSSSEQVLSLDFLIKRVSFVFFEVYFRQGLHKSKCISMEIFSRVPDSLYWLLSQQFSAFEQSKMKNFRFGIT